MKMKLLTTLAVTGLMAAALTVPAQALQDKTIFELGAAEETDFKGL